MTGSAGFIAGYLVEELLGAGTRSSGSTITRNMAPWSTGSTPTPTTAAYVVTPRMSDWSRSCWRTATSSSPARRSSAASTLFHELAYDLIAENERITAAAFDAAIDAAPQGAAPKNHRRLIVDGLREHERLSLLPRENSAAARRPGRRTGSRSWRPSISPRGPGNSTGLPYTIVRPFNCIGIGEKRALSDKAVMSGNVKLAMSHVVPDLVQKVLKGQDPLHIFGDGQQVRCYTYGGDLARGIRLAIESPGAINEDFNLSTDRSTTVLELVRADLDTRSRETTRSGTSRTSRYTYDVQKRVPSVEKAQAGPRVRGHDVAGEALDEIIPWIGKQIEIGGI